MARSENWVFSRPHRKLTYIPQTLSILMSTAQGEVWANNKELHINFENHLDAAGYKTGGDYLDRKRLSDADRESNNAKWKNGGSGGRTHKALVESLGLVTPYYDRSKEYDSNRSRENASILLPTLAGQALLDGEDARPILTRQVLAHQFPSAHSVKSGVGVPERFKLRPAILILKLLKHPDLGGYLTDLEIGVCAVPYGERHTDAEANKIATRILAWREHKEASLTDDFDPKFSHFTERHSVYNRVPKNLINYADTLMKWLDYTGFTMDSVTKDGETCSILNESMMDEINEAIKFWGRKPLLNVDKDDPQVFQRQYGVTISRSKDNRRLGPHNALSPAERERRLVEGVIRFELRTQLITEVSAALITRVVNKTGIEERRVQELLNEILPSADSALAPFLQTYRDMAYMGQEEATDFEKATASICSSVFDLNAQHVGQSNDRKEPDVTVGAKKKSWFGIIDNKAYSRYDLPSDHQLRMEGYVKKYQKYAETIAKTFEFFMYISGGFVPNINQRMKHIGDNVGTHYSAINILTWITLIERFSRSQRQGDDLIELFTLNREILLSDVENFLNK